MIKTKDHALLMFEKFKRLVENSHNRCIKILCTDGGGESFSQITSLGCVKMWALIVNIQPHTHRSRTKWWSRETGP